MTIASRPPCASRIFSSIVLAFLFLSACGVINGNGYRFLSSAEKSALKPFSASYLDTSVAHRPGLFEVEVEGDSLRRALRDRPYTWVYWWIYYCRDSSCRPLWYYEQQAQQYRQEGLSLLLVSQVYDPATLKKYVDRFGFSAPVYVPAARVYGQGMYRARGRLTRALTGDAALARSRPAHLLFRHDTLLYAGEAVPPLDRLLRGARRH